MFSRTTRAFVLFVALTFSFGLPVFATEEAMQPAGSTAGSAIASNDAGSQKEKKIKYKKRAKKKRMDKKSKKHRKHADE